MKPTTINTIKVNGRDVEYIKINCSANGSPRYIIHFTDIADDYNEALKLSRTIGGKKYMGKDYKGCIVISSYSLATDLSHIIRRADEQN